MSAKAPSAVLDEFRDAIRATMTRFGVSEAGVFGSTARGSDRIGSDLDLIVEFAPGERRDLIHLSDALSDLTGLQVDVVDHQAVRSRAAKTGIGSSLLRDTVPL
ncbi:nucleotidyltransferase domain-containing protein [Subtercola sp. PAMC28395]|uniref:nucleotidyltransferase family protein n=1 Tax=Subtercola sp. PAMC28395 TaxID=2846775 RepID=UPI001C0D06F2|nr:nucleotidyltransferase domain-containing protein [Subtercola sp. PAMC28395]QWT25156.1 nucleotidyltransferase domain-containing protein [Subtercola sp. PAMC28395]